jgi:hypothetical protein
MAGSSELVVADVLWSGEVWQKVAGALREEPNSLVMT